MRINNHLVTTFDGGIEYDAIPEIRDPDIGEGLKLANQCLSKDLLDAMGKIIDSVGYLLKRDVVETIGEVVGLCDRSKYSLWMGFSLVVQNARE